MFSVVLGITGHRDIVPEQYESIIQEFDALLSTLNKEHPNLAIRVITGMAEGAG